MRSPVRSKLVIVPSQEDGGKGAERVTEIGDRRPRIPGRATPPQDMFLLRPVPVAGSIRLAIVPPVVMM